MFFGPTSRHVVWATVGLGLWPRPGSGSWQSCSVVECRRPWAWSPAPQNKANPHKTHSPPPPASSAQGQGSPAAHPSPSACAGLFLQASSVSCGPVQGQHAGQHGHKLLHLSAGLCGWIELRTSACDPLGFRIPGWCQRGERCWGAEVGGMRPQPRGCQELTQAREQIPPGPAEGARPGALRLPASEPLRSRSGFLQFLSVW